MLLDKMKRFRSFAQVLFFLPYILPVSVVTQIWLWVLNTNYGIYNFLLQNHINWFKSVPTAMPAVALVTIWWTVGFNVLLFIAGLKAIPREMYEAAALDGVDKGFRVFRYITWPLLWPVTSLVLLLQLIAQWQIFNQVYLLTNGGPFNKTIVVLQYMYVQAFQNGHGGYASTISIALFVIILITSLIQLKFLSLKGNS
jgi:multiple sugar transport system permease protein